MKKNQQFRAALPKDSGKNSISYWTVNYHMQNNKKSNNDLCGDNTFGSKDMMVGGDESFPIKNSEPDSPNIVDRNKTNPLVDKTVTNPLVENDTARTVRDSKRQSITNAQNVIMVSLPRSPNKSKLVVFDGLNPNIDSV